VGQDPSAPIGLDSNIVLRRRVQRLFDSLDKEIGVGLDPRMIEGRVIGNEIEHQPQTALGEPGTELGQRRHPAECLLDLIGADGEARSANILLRQIRQCRLKSGPPSVFAARHRPARRTPPPNAQEPDPVETLTREAVQGGVIDLAKRDRLAGLLRETIKPGPGVDLEQRGIARKPGQTFGSRLAWRRPAARLARTIHAARRSYWRSSRSSPSGARHPSRVHCRHQNIRRTGYGP
jgi:hypothetical protein